MFTRNTTTQLMTFKVGDRVAVHNMITGNKSYEGVIVRVSNQVRVYDGHPERYAEIKMDGIDGVRRNMLGSARIIG